MTRSSGGLPPAGPRPGECAEIRVALGVYVLGSIDPAERAQVEGHLATCPDCRDELAGLAGLPALLARVPRAEAIALGAADGPPGAVSEAPPELLSTVLDLTAARRRRRRWREAAVGVAAAMIIAAGTFAGLRLGSGAPAQPAATASGHFPGSPAGPWATATGQTPSAASGGAMSAMISYRPMGWGTQLETRVTGIPVGTSCQLWVLGAGGKRVLAGGWVTDNGEGTVWYPGSASLPSKDVTGFEVTVGSGRAVKVAA